MAGTYKLLELVGTSPISFAEATKAAIAEASKRPSHGLVRGSPRTREHCRRPSAGIPGHPESRLQDRTVVETQVILAWRAKFAGDAERVTSCFFSGKICAVTSGQVSRRGVTRWERFLRHLIYQVSGGGDR